MKHSARTRWLSVTTLLLACALGTPGVRAQEPDVWDKLYGPDVRPHPMILTSERALKWCLDADNLADLKAHDVGPVVLFESLHENREKPTERDGVKGYHYQDPDLVAKVTRALRMIGCRVGGYINGYAWRHAGLTPLDAIEEIKRHGWEVVYFDNEGVSQDPQVLMWFMGMVKSLGVTIICHTSITAGQQAEHGSGPYADRYTRVVPLWQRLYANYRRVNETGPNPPGPVNDWEPATMKDALWWTWVSGVMTTDHSIGGIKFGAYNQPSGGDEVTLHRSRWKGQEHIVLPVLPGLGCVHYVYPGTEFRVFQQYYWPEYVKRRAEFLADPAAFRAARAREFGMR